MPRFFYDFFDGQTWSQDDEGIELPSAEQAFVEAFAGARGMWHELVDDRSNPLACAFDIRGEGGQSLFRFDFTELLGRKARASVASLPIGRMVSKLEETHARASRARVDLNHSLEQTLRSLREARTMVARLEPFGRPRYQ